MSSSGWRSVVYGIVGVLATIVAIEFALRTVLEPSRLREVDHGIHDLRVAIPDTLVLGSSHARTFHVLGEEISRRTGAPAPLVAVPLEYGKLTGYRWVLMNRIAPTLDGAAGRAGATAKPTRLVLVTEWWDSCDEEQGRLWNLPARAWTWRDYLSDVLDDGFTAFNRNFLQTELRRLAPGSLLVADRTNPRIRTAVANALRGSDGRMSPAEHERMTGIWRRMVETGIDCIGSPIQMRALEDVLEFAGKRGMQAIVVLFPRKPSTLTDKARSTTLARFRAMVDGTVARHGATLIDLTTSSPVGDEDFMDDFDHINAAGNLKFSAWALDHELQFMLEPARASNAQASSHGAVR